MAEVTMRERVAAQVQHALFRWSTNKACGRGEPYVVADAILPLIEEAVTAERERVGLILDAVQSSLDSNGSYCECSGYQRVKWLEGQIAAIRGGEGE